MKLSEGLRKGLAIKEKIGRPYCAAVIVAAGTSSRMGGTNKILTVLENLPVICRTVDVFDKCAMIDEIIVVTQQELLEKVSYVFGKSCQEHGAVSRIHLHHAGIMLADGTRNLWIFEQYRSGNLEESHFMDEDLVVGVVIALHHVNLLLYCLVDFLNLLFITPNRDGILVYILDTAGRNIQALDVYLSATKHGSNLIQDTGNVF